MSLLTDTLIKGNFITEEQLKDAKDKQLGAKKPIHELLVEMGFLKEEDLINVSSKVFKMPVLDLNTEKIDNSATKSLPCESAKKYGVFPIRKEQESLVLAMIDPRDIITLEDVRIIANVKRIIPILATKSQISKCIEKYYQLDDDLYDLLKNVSDDTKIELIGEEKLDEDDPDIDALKGKSSPVAKLANLIISDAIRIKASDIHIEPQEKFTDVRYRIDGHLKNIMQVPAKFQSSLVSRIKILADLDIAEKRKTQDGRSKISVNERNVDLRISIIPTFFGEKVVMRILDSSQANVDLNRTGMQEEELKLFKNAVNKPQGIVLVTGPTGSGKTSTLYAALNFVKNETKNIVTIEDPIEYLMEGINQIQVNPVKDVTFAAGLRSILRQDPNVILVGEIRDRETADIAFRSSLTGHLVLSTLHTNNAVNTITRLLDIGLPPYLISSSIIMVVAQRLVRQICPNCKEEYTPDTDMIEKFRIYINELGVEKFYRGKGCEQCGFTGYRGRTAIFEMLNMTEKVRNLITHETKEDEMFKEARKGGLRPLARSGVEKVRMGITTLEELATVVAVVGEESKEEVRPSPSLLTGRPLSKEVGEIHKTPRILLVDDDAFMRDILKSCFIDAGYDVSEASDGKKAIEVAFKEKPDLIVTDVVMPNMNGFEATKALRSKLETATIPIIMLTSVGDKESELKGLDAGADDYITKSSDTDKLLARIKILLRRSQWKSY